MTNLDPLAFRFDGPDAASEASQALFAIRVEHSVSETQVVALCERLLAHGVRVEPRPDGHACVMAPDPSHLAGEPLSCVSEQPLRALEWAVGRSFGSKTLRAIAALGFKPDLEKRRHPLLHMAIMGDRFEIGEALIELGCGAAAAEPTIRATPLHALADADSPSLERAQSWIELLVGHGADINAADLNGFTPAALALKGGSPAVLDALLRSGARFSPASLVADEEQGGFLDSLSPLMIAARGSFPECLRVVIENGADWTARDGFDRTILHLLLDERKRDIDDALHLELVLSAVEAISGLLARPGAPLPAALSELQDSDGRLPSEALAKSRHLAAALAPLQALEEAIALRVNLRAARGAKDSAAISPGAEAGPAFDDGKTASALDSQGANARAGRRL
jgi:ankyrin repeat protein